MLWDRYAFQIYSDSDSSKHFFKSTVVIYFFFWGGGGGYIFFYLLANHKNRKFFYSLELDLHTWHRKWTIQAKKSEISQFFQGLMHPKFTAALNLKNCHHCFEWPLLERGKFRRAFPCIESINCLQKIMKSKMWDLCCVVEVELVISILFLTEWVSVIRYFQIRCNWTKGELKKCYVQVWPTLKI